MTGPDSQNQDNQDNQGDATVTGMSGDVSPAFVRARQAALDAEDEAIEAGEKAAFARATRKYDDDPKKPGDASISPGFKSATNPDPSITTPAPVFGRVDTSGKGWVSMRDENGKLHRVRDDGASIHIPGSPRITPQQMQLVAQLAQEKGWTRVAVFKSSGSGLHPAGTQLLSNLIGSNCCTDPNAAGKLRHHLANSEETFRRTILSRREAAQDGAKHPAPVV